MSIERLSTSITILHNELCCWSIVALMVWDRLTPLFSTRRFLV